MFEVPQRILSSIHGSLVFQHEAEQLCFLDGALRYGCLLLQVFNFFMKFLLLPEEGDTYLMQIRKKNSLSNFK